MFPNPQDALPLPRHPSLEQYRKLAKELVRACRSADAGAIGAWADRWIASLARASEAFRGPRIRQSVDRAAGEVEDFAKRHLAAKCNLAEAQFVIARSHGFITWPRFVEHVERLATGNEEAAFEAAVDALIDGNEVALAGLLRDHPGLVRAKSTREHGATLLIYTSANGVEGFRQRTPQNIVRIAEMLLDAGADIDGTAHVYGGDCSTLGLAATSAHPRIAKVQIPLLELLLARGAGMDDGAGGHRHGVVYACLANGCPEAAAFLADRGARLTLVDAAALGRMNEVRHFFESAAPDQELINEALRYACAYGTTEVAEYLLGRGADLADGPGDGQTATHYAVITGHLDTLRMLLKHNPPLEAKNMYGGTVLGQAAWSAAHGDKSPELYIEIIQALLDAGAVLPERHVPVNEKVDAFLASKGSVAEPSWYWYGEKPRGR